MLKITEKTGPWGVLKKTLDVPLIEGGTIWDYIPDWMKRLDVVSIILNGTPQHDEELNSVVPRDGDELQLAPYYGVIGFILSVALQVFSWGYKQNEQEALKQNRWHSRVGKTGQFNVMQIETQEGHPIPIIDGEMRTAAQLLQVFTDQRTQGRDRLNFLLGHCEGPVEAVNPNGFGDVHVDGNALGNYSVSEYVTRTGTLNDTPARNFDKSVTNSAVNIQLSRGSSVILGGTGNADYFRLKVTFITGIYTIDNNSHFHGARFVCRLRYRTTAGPGAWSAWFRPAGDPFEAAWPGSYYRRRSTPVSIFFGLDFPSIDTYDVEIDRDQGTGHDGTNQIIDSYIKEYQQFQDEYLRYPFIAKSYITLLATDQMSGTVPNVTSIIRGRKPMLLTSATLASAPTWTKNVSQLMLDKIYNWRFGGATRIDQRLQLTLSGVAGGPYTVGELVLGPAVADGYQFRGFVRAWDNGTSEMLVESRRGLPYGVLTGDLSGATGTVASIDEAYGVDLQSFWDYALRCDEWVPDGGPIANVNGDSAAAGNIVFVDDTSPFSVDNQIVLDYEGPKEEDQKVQAILAGPTRLQIYGTLTNTHLAVEQNEVSVAERRHEFDHEWSGQEDLRTCLDRYARTSQAFIVYEPKIRVVPFRLETPGDIICRGNTGVRSFKMTWGDGPFNRSNRLVAQFRDRDHDYNFNYGSLDAPELETNPEEEVVEENTEFLGKTRASEVTRQLFFRLKRLRYVGRAASLLLGPDHLGMQVGDVRWLQNDVPGIGLDGGRVVRATATTVDLNRAVTIPAGTHFIRIRTNDGVQQSLQITNPTGTWKQITVSGSFSPVPVQWDLWAIGELGRFRCMGIKPNQDGEAECNFEEDAPEYYSDKFGTVPTFAPTTLPDPNEIPPDVEDIRLLEGVARLPGGQLQHYVDVSFHAPAHNNYSYAEVWMKEMSARFQKAGTTDFTSDQGTSPVEFAEPLGVWAGLIGSTKTVIVADTGNHRILILDENLQFLGQIGTTGVSGDSASLLRFPADVCCDGIYIYLLDTGNHKVKVYNATTYAWVSTFGTRGNVPGEFEFPNGIATLAGDNVVHVADTYNNRIQRFTVAAGVLTFNLVIGSSGPGNDQFVSPYGIDVGNSNVFVADLGNSRVTWRDKVTYVYTSQLGSGPGDDPDELDRPVDVTVNPSEDDVWICDMANHRLSHWDSVGPLPLGVKGSHGQGRDQFKVPRGIQNFDDANFVVEKYNNQLTVRDENEGNPNFFEFRETVPNGETSIRVKGDLTPGELYRFAVPSVSPNEVRKLPIDAVYAELELTAVGNRPPTVANLYAANDGGGVRLYWDGVQGVDVAGYYLAGGTDWATGIPIATVGRDAVEYTLSQSAIASAGNAAYMIKAFTTSQQESLNPAFVTHQYPGIAPLANALRTRGAVTQRTT